MAFPSPNKLYACLEDISVFRVTLTFSHWAFFQNYAKIFAEADVPTHR